MLTVRQLECFQAVARELHFTRAANSLRIAQPALSQQIRKLERQLGLALFERNNHRVLLTPAGTALLAHTERVLSDLTAIEQEMLGWAGGIRGRIRLGAARGLMMPLARVLAAFCQAYPAVEIELQEQSTDEMLAGLHAGRLDLATLAARPDLGDRGLALRPLGEEALVLVVGERSPFAARSDRVPLVELDGVEVVRYPPGSAVGRIVRASLGEAGVRSGERFESREYSTARTLAHVGLAAAIMPRSVAEAPGPAVRVLRLDPEPVWTPALAWAAGRRPAPALRVLIDFVVRSPELTSDRETDLPA